MGKTITEIRTAMLAKAKRSGLTPADVSRLKLIPHTAATLAKIEKLPEYRGAFVIPYFDFNGKPTKFFRVRYVEDPTGFTKMTQSKILRYAQPKGTINEIYLPPFIDWKKYAASDKSVFITEGELKSACATKMGLPVVGIGGVSMFSNRKQGHFMLPQFNQFEWKDRDAYIVFDSDAPTNPNILRAEAMLCRELTRVGAFPHVVRIPQLGDEKTGLDDFLLHPDGGAAHFKELVDSATDYKMSELLYALNEECIFVNTPNIVYNPAMDRRMRPADFVKSHYANWRMLVASDKTVTEKSAAQEWLNWPERSEVENFTYSPGGEDIIDGKLNLWKPWPHVPVKGDVSLWQKLLDHIFQPNEIEQRRWFEKWIAYPMQHPGAKLKQACIFHGGQGTGKSFMAEIIMRIYGEDNSTKFGNVQLNSAFNSWAEHMQFAVGEEIVVHSGEKRSLSEMLKTIVTDTTISIRRLYLNPYNLPNCMNVMLLGNHAALLKLEEDDRRFFVHHVKAAKMGADLYRPLDTWSKSPAGLSALFHYFLSLDLTGFDPQAAAMHTPDRGHMIAGGRSEHGTWIAELKDNPDDTLRIDKARIPFALFTAEDLMMIYKARHDRTSITATTLANELSMHGFRRAYPHAVRTAGGAKRLWVVRELVQFKKFTAGQYGEWYDKEREMVKKTTPAKKGKF